MATATNPAAENTKTAFFIAEKATDPLLAPTTITDADATPRNAFVYNTSVP